MINSVGVLMSLWLNNKVIPSFEMPDEVLHGKMTRDPTALKHPNMGSVSVNGTGGVKGQWFPCSPLFHYTGGEQILFCVIRHPSSS